MSGESHEPDRESHGVWFAMLVVMPAVLMTLASFGLGIATPRALALASLAARLALTGSLVGCGVALLSRRRRLIESAGLGLSISIGVYVLLWWIAGQP